MGNIIDLITRIPKSHVARDHLIEIKARTHQIHVKLRIIQIHYSQLTQPHCNIDITKDTENTKNYLTECLIDGISEYLIIL